MNKKYIISGLIVIIFVVVVAGYFGYRKYNSNPRFVSHEFAALVQSVDNNRIQAQGNFVLLDQPGQSVPSEQKNVDVVILLDRHTKFNKNSIHLPTPAQADKDGGWFNLSNLPHEVSEVSIGDFQADLKKNGGAITVHADKNIYQAKSFTAAEIDYNLSVFPDDNPPAK